MENLNKAFERSPLLSLSSEEVASFKALARALQTKVGHIVFCEEDCPDYIYLIQTGHVKIYRNTPLGKIVTVGIRNPGDVIGVAEVLTGMNRCCFAETMEASELWQMKGEIFLAMLQSQTKLAVKVAAALGNRLREAETTILNLVTLEVDHRLAKLLLNLAKAGVVQGEKGLRISVLLTHQELASMIGTCRQTVTTTLRRFKDEGAIHTGKRYIEIVDGVKLNSYANS